MEIEVSTEIRKPPEAVFDFLAHHPNHLRFIEQNVSCEQVSPGPMAVGTRVRNTARLFGKLGGRMEENFEIVSFDRPTLLKKASLPGSSFETTDAFHLEPTPAGTRVRLVVTGNSSSAAKRLLLSLMGSSLRKNLDKALTKLKTILEQP